jgi:uncharacterized repeat protein (TIGR02543 family)
MLNKLILKSDWCGLLIIITILFIYENAFAACSSPPCYTVTYNANGCMGIAPTDNTQYLNGAPLFVQSPASSSYADKVFSDWNTQSSGNGFFYWPGSPLIINFNSTKLNAICGYTVIYDLNGGTGTLPVDPNVYLDTDYVTIQGAPGISNGYATFLGWNTAPDGSGITYQPRSTYSELSLGSKCIALYAMWGYTVAYDKNGGDGTTPTDSNLYLSGKKAKVYDGNGLSKSGYVFNGWNTSPNGNGKYYQVCDPLIIENNNVILYAAWQNIASSQTSPFCSSSICYGVTYNANGGWVAPPIDYVDHLSGTTLGVKTGYCLENSGKEFLGWNNTAGSVATGLYYWTNSSPITLVNNAALKAIWGNTVTYDKNGGEGRPPSIQLNTLIHQL